MRLGSLCRFERALKIFISVIFHHLLLDGFSTIGRLAAHDAGQPRPALSELVALDALIAPRIHRPHASS